MKDNKKHDKDSEVLGLYETYGHAIVSAWERKHACLLGGSSIYETHMARKSLLRLICSIEARAIILFLIVSVVFIVCGMARDHIPSENSRGILVAVSVVAGFLFLVHSSLKLKDLTKEIRIQKKSAGNLTIQEILNRLSNDIRSIGCIRSNTEALEMLVQKALNVRRHESYLEKGRGSASQVHLSVMIYLLEKARNEFDNLFHALTTKFDGLVTVSKADIFAIAETKFIEGGEK